MTRIKVQPGARRDEVAGMHGDAIKVRIRAPAVDGKANEALLDFISGALGVPRRLIAIKIGHASKIKLIKVSGMDPADVQSILLSKSKKHD